MPGCRHHLNTSPFPYLFLATSLSSFMSLHSRISPPAPSFSCCPGFSNVAPGKLRENGRVNGTALTPLHPFPCLCCLFRQGCLRGPRFLRQREESTLHHVQAGRWVSHQENGEKGASISPSAGRGGKSAALPPKGTKARKEEMEDGGGERSPAIHPPVFWYWIGLLPLVPPSSPSLAAPC